MQSAAAMQSARKGAFTADPLDFTDAVAAFDNITMLIFNYNNRKSNTVSSDRLVWLKYVSHLRYI